MRDRHQPHYSNSTDETFFSFFLTQRIELAFNSGRPWSLRVHPAVSPWLTPWVFSTRTGVQPSRTQLADCHRNSLSHSLALSATEDDNQQIHNNVCLLSQPGLEPPNFRKVGCWCHHLNHRETIASYKNIIRWVRRTTVKHIQRRCFRLTLSYIPAHLAPMTYSAALSVFFGF